MDTAINPQMDLGLLINSRAAVITSIPTRLLTSSMYVGARSDDPSGPKTLDWKDACINEPDTPRMLLDGQE